MRRFHVKPDPDSAKVVARITDHLRERYRNGQESEVVVGDPKRTLPENALLHALLAELSRKLEWAGAKRSAEVWKRLVVSAWCRVEGKGVEILPALDGHGVDIVPVRTSRLSKRDCAELIEWIYAFGVEQGIRWDEHREIQP